jgi:subtilisin family serine protease
MLFSIQLLLTFLTTFFALVHSTPTPHRGSKVKGLGVPVRNSEATNVIANRYIVVYNGNATDDAIDAHQASVMSALKKRNLSARGPNGKTLSTKVDTVKMSGWRCMALEAEGSTMLEIASASEVAYIEADTIVKAAALVEQTVAPTGLKRISHAAAGGAGYVFDDSAGTGITAFVVDTGIRTTHSVRPSESFRDNLLTWDQEFGGRATFGANMVNNVVCL